MTTNTKIQRLPSGYPHTAYKHALAALSTCSQQHAMLAASLNWRSMQRPVLFMQQSSAKQAFRPARLCLARSRSDRLQRSARVCSISSASSGSTAKADAESGFSEGFQQLQEWHEQYGNCYVPRCPDGASLLEWISHVRKQWRSKRLTPQQIEQLNALDFVWKPKPVEAQWHWHYHTVRCWLESSSENTLQQLLQYASEVKESDTAEDLNLSWLLSDSEARELRVKLQQGPYIQSPLFKVQDLQQEEQQEQQQQPTEQQLHDAALWLFRQIQLYNKLRLTPLKVQMMRRLGARLRRQPGLTKPHMHPLLLGLNPAQYKRRPIVVQPATKQGKRAVMDIITQHKQRQKHLVLPVRKLHLPASSLPRPGDPSHVWGSHASLPVSSASPADEKDSSSGNTSNCNMQQQQQLQHRGDCEADGDREADMAFMTMIAKLQAWKKKYKTCYVPKQLFDAPDLAQFVDSMRRWRAAVQGVDQPSSQPELFQQQQQQQQQPRKQLAEWHVEELDAVGFVWEPDQDEEEWNYWLHQLRFFKQLHLLKQLQEQVQGVSNQPAPQQPASQPHKEKVVYREPADPGPLAAELVGDKDPEDGDMVIEASSYDSTPEAAAEAATLQSGIKIVEGVTGADQPLRHGTTAPEQAQGDGSKPRGKATESPAHANDGRSTSAPMAPPATPRAQTQLDTDRMSTITPELQPKWAGLLQWLQQQEADYAARRLKPVQVKLMRLVGWHFSTP